MKNKRLASKAIMSVLAEMDRQDEKWGANRDLDPFLWAAILGEEVGEFNQSILHDFYGGKHAGTVLVKSKWTLLIDNFHTQQGSHPR
ncbi:hypothetical protein AF41_00317 [Citrobacter sp. MGH 55]|nr:hypothetical protein AF41_00317 [Citrobacter sp. MGH 55]